MQRKGKLRTLLIGLQIGAATMKMPQKIKNRTTTQSNNSTPQYLSKENENTNLKRYMHPYAHCWRRQWHPTPVLLPGKSHGRKSLVGCSQWGHYESDTTEWLHFHTLEKEMATHSNVLVLRISGTGEPGGLPSTGSHRVRHNWSDLAACSLQHYSQ